MKKLSLLLAFFALIILTGCQSKPAPTADLDGTIITIGSSVLGELFDAGFERKESIAGYQEESMPANSWTYQYYYVQKNEDAYAGFALLNTTSGEKPVAECRIHKIIYTLFLEETDFAYPDILINGVNFRGYTVEQVKGAMKGYKLSSESADNLKFKSGKYNYEFRFSDGVVQVIMVEMNFSKSYS